MLTKIVTCCYCGTRAALVLDQGRHELSCAACGAPLHDMKFMPERKTAKESVHNAVQPKTNAPKPAAYASAKSSAKYRLEEGGNPSRKYHKKLKKKKKSFSLKGKMAGKIWDAIEDIFD